MNINPNRMPEPRKVARKVRKLSPAQTALIKHMIPGAEYVRATDPLPHVTAHTIDALVSMGLIAQSYEPKFHYWLSPAGVEKKKELRREA